MGESISPKKRHMTIVDLATDDDVTVTATPARLLGVLVNVVMSAHTALVKDGSTTKLTLPASSAANLQIECFGAQFDTSIVIESNDSGTGTLVIFWEEL